MTTQDERFLHGEGDAWFRRNAASTVASGDLEWPMAAAIQVVEKDHVSVVADLGCANGWQLDRISRWVGSTWVGVDASSEAIADGRSRFPHLDLRRGELARLPLHEACDLVIVNFVLHWVDRTNLSAVVAEIDRVVVDGGWLIIGDFLPDRQEKRSYHHLPDEGVFTFKQDYARIFTSLGTYRECARVVYDHEAPTGGAQAARSTDRAACVLLVKSGQRLYPNA